MSDKTLGSRIKHKVDTAANWVSNNPVLLAGEIGVESDTNKFKFGNGTSVWTSLTYAGSSGGVTSLTDLGVTATSTELNYVDGVTSSIQAQLDTKASLASPALTGTPTAPTATAGTNTTQVATTAFVKTALDANTGGQYLGNASVKAISYNAQSIAENITIPGTANAYSCGPITIADTYTVTISDGGNWTVF